MIPTFESYMKSSSRNYGLNSIRFFDASGVSYWFSYQTLVAFKVPGLPIVCRENTWGPTTGKHLNAIEPDKSKRESAEVFQRIFVNQLGTLEEKKAMFISAVSGCA